MIKKLTAPNTHFSDSEFRSFELKENNLLNIYFTSWDERLITIECYNPIYFIYQLGYHIENIYETNNSHLLNEIVSKYYEKVPPHHPFKLFMVNDLEDFSFMQIIAESLNITKGSSIIGFKNS